MPKLLLVISLILIAAGSVYAADTVYAGHVPGESQLSIEIDFATANSFEIGFTRESDISVASENPISSSALTIDHEDGRAKDDGNLYVYWNIRTAGPFSIKIESDGILDRIGGGGSISYRIQLEDMTGNESSDEYVIYVPAVGNGNVSRLSKGTRGLSIETDVIGEDILSGEYTDTLWLVLSDEA